MMLGMVKLVYVALSVYMIELVLMLYPKTLEDLSTNVMHLLHSRQKAILYCNDSWHDTELTSQQSTYPICSTLNQYHSRSVYSNWFADVQLYTSWLQDGSMVCGKYKQHKISSLLGWKSKKRDVAYWREGCARQIPAAKRRLHTFLTALCSNQAAANRAYHSLTFGDGTCSAEGSTTLNDASFDKQGSRCAQTTDGRRKVDDDADVIAGRGIVYTGEPRHFKHIYQSLMSLVLAGASLPAEVWVNHYAFAACRRAFGNFDFVRCRCFGDIISTSDVHTVSRNDKCSSRAVVTGFESKFHALLSTDFQHVLYLDADNIVTRDPTEVFLSPEYLATGAVLWPDLWGVACRDTSRILAGHTAAAQYVLWKAQFPGLDGRTHKVPTYYYEHARCMGDPQCAAVHWESKNKKRNKNCSESSTKCACAGVSTSYNDTSNAVANITVRAGDSPHNSGCNKCQYKHEIQDNSWRSHLREHAQEAESGQVVLNLRRHKPLLHLGLRLMQDRAFFGRVFYGDKDIFRYIFLLTGLPFHFMGMPGISVDRAGRQDSLLHFHSVHSDHNRHTSVASSGDRGSDTLAHQVAVSAPAAHSGTTDNTCRSAVADSHTNGRTGDSNREAVQASTALPLFVHQLRLRDPDALLRYIRVPAEHRHSASYCLVPAKRSYISEGNVSTGGRGGGLSSGNASSGDGGGDSSAAGVDGGGGDGAGRRVGSGVLVHPASAVLLRNLARRLFSKVDVEWRETQN